MESTPQRTRRTAGPWGKFLGIQVTTSTTQSEGAPEGDGQGQTEAEICISVNPPETSTEVLRSHHSTRNPQPRVRYQEYMESQQANMMVNEVAVYLPDLECQQAMANGNPDVMHWHEAMHQPDKHEFVRAAEDETQAHTDNGLWEI